MAHGVWLCSRLPALFVSLDGSPLMKRKVSISELSTPMTEEFLTWKVLATEMKFIKSD